MDIDFLCLIGSFFYRMVEAFYVLIKAMIPSLKFRTNAAFIKIADSLNGRAELLADAAS